MRDRFADRPVVQFTATPFREDGKHLSGHLVYAFPLRKAQEQGYFSRINYTSVIDFDDVDRSVARRAIDQLRKDLEVGHDHILMARVDGIPRATELLPLYEELAADLKPVIINSQMSKKSQSAALKGMHERTSRVIVCVNMLGEGFDLPTVGVLDIHSQFRRFSMHVGSDVTEGFSTSEARTKTQTNISGNGYRDGDRVNISASLKGRIWSHAAAPSLRHWCNWCDGVGTKLHQHRGHHRQLPRTYRGHQQASRCAARS